MQNWINFWNCFFWISLLGFVVNPSNFINLIFFSEISWLSIYIISTLLGTINDDITLTTLSFFILALAGLEFAFGFLLLILFKTYEIAINFAENEKDHTQFINFNKNSLYLNNFLWIK